MNMSPHQFWRRLKRLREPLRTLTPYCSFFQGQEVKWSDEKKTNQSKNGLYGKSYQKKTSRTTNIIRLRAINKDSMCWDIAILNDIKEIVIQTQFLELIFDFCHFDHTFVDTDQQLVVQNSPVPWKPTFVNFPHVIGHLWVYSLKYGFRVTRGERLHVETLRGHPSAYHLRVVVVPTLVLLREWRNGRLQTWTLLSHHFLHHLVKCGDLRDHK